jgi:Tol biopolymer transport system component
VSDRGGPENVWQRPAAPGGTDRRLTSFTTGRVLWPSSTRDARTVAFERDFGIWTLDVGSGQARQVPIVRRGAPTSPSLERVRQTNRFSDLALSPDGRKIAFVARGDVFAVSARDGGDATRATATAAIESQPVWAPDSRRLAYVSTSRAGQHIHLHDFTTNASSALTSGAVTDLSPVFSPDGSPHRFPAQSARASVYSTSHRRPTEWWRPGVLADTIDSPKPVWSPDGRWLAVFAIGTKAFTNVELVPAEGGTLVPVSFLANTYANSMAWSADGTYLLFDTASARKTASSRASISYREHRNSAEDLFRDLFNEPQRDSNVPDGLEPDRANPEPGTPEPRNRGPVFTDIRSA